MPPSKRWVETLDLRALAPKLGLKPGKGNVVRCIDPAHDDKRPSMTVYADGAHCFSCGKHYGIVDFASALLGKDREAAVEWLRQEAGAEPVSLWKVDRVERLEVMDKDTRERSMLTLTDSWDYLSETGVKIYSVARFQDKDGRKEYRPYRPTHDGKFVIGRPPNPVALFNLPDVAKSDRVVVVEGEKCAAALARLIAETPGAAAKGIAATTWMGGTSSVKGADWTPLKGKSVIVWPDNDKPGKAAAIEIADIIAALPAKVKVVTPGPDWAPKIDVADLIGAGWQWSHLAGHMRNSSIEREAPKAEQTESTVEVADAIVAQMIDNEHFRTLGYASNRSHHYVVVYRKADGQIYDVSSTNVTEMFLCDLADDTFWELLFPPLKKGGEVFVKPNIRAMRKAMRKAAEQVGRYDSRRVRGRGWHWTEDGAGGMEPVLNTGKSLYRRGRFEPLEASGSAVWIEKLPVDWGGETPADGDINREVWEFVAKQVWSHPVQKFCVAGWLALAPLCGLLNFRPSLWLRGDAGVGKTFFVNKVQDLLGDTLKLLQGGSSEAGIRRLLMHDALAILIDEFESGGQHKRIVAANILDVMRIGGSGKGGRVAKAELSSSDGVTDHSLRCMFMCSSIGKPPGSEANESRFIEAQIVRPKGMGAQEFREHQLGVIKPAVQFIERPDSRASARYLHWLREHVTDITGCVDIGVAALHDSQHDLRFAQLHGSLIAAGLYLRDGRQPLPKEVVAVSAELEQSAPPRAKDHVDLMNHILAIPVDLAQDAIPRPADHQRDHDSEKVPAVRKPSVASLLRVALGDSVVGLPLNPRVAQAALAHVGVLVGDPPRTNGYKSDRHHIALAANHREIRRGLAGTEWDNDYGERLCRTIAHPIPGRVSFASTRFQAIRIDLTHIPQLSIDQKEPGEDREEDDENVPF